MKPRDDKHEIGPDAEEPRRPLNRRNPSDRRCRRGLSFHHFLFGGKRRQLRRKEDKHALLFVDEYSPALMGCIAALLVLSFLDGFMTLYLLEHDMYEVNPVMAFCLSLGPWFFLYSKFLLTCFGAMCLLVVNNNQVFNDRIKVKDIFPAILLLYFLVMAWHSYLYSIA
ncbi:MAG: DUF5658 family protein [Desulfobacterales bacterium]|jgi:H+/Cl- antiporter ClcA|nr:DUF5658 family protein [Desulfobacterales bacterium]